MVTLFENLFSLLLNKPKKPVLDECVDTQEKTSKNTYTLNGDDSTELDLESYIQAQLISISVDHYQELIEKAKLQNLKEIESKYGELVINNTIVPYFIYYVNNGQIKFCHYTLNSDVKYLRFCLIDGLLYTVET